MADGRLIHKRSSHGERVLKLTDFEYRVWMQYLLSADDYGVMRASPSVLLADNPRLEKAPLRSVAAAIRTLIDVGLVDVFHDQGVRFLWQRDWQDWQHVRYPRDTVNPTPSAPDSDRASDETRWLFGLYGKPSSVRRLLYKERAKEIKIRNKNEETQELIPETSQEDIREVSVAVEESSQNRSGPHARGGARNTNTNTNTKKRSGSGSSEESARETVVAIEPARRTFTRHNGLMSGHTSCFYMPAACAAGMCIPPWLGEQWTAQYRGDRAAAEVEIKAFVGARLHGLEPGQDPAKYWKAAWTAHHGAVVPSAPHSDRATRTMNAAEAVIARQMAAQKALK